MVKALDCGSRYAGSIPVGLPTLMVRDASPCLAISEAWNPPPRSTTFEPYLHSVVVACVEVGGILQALFGDVGSSEGRLEDDAGRSCSCLLNRSGPKGQGFKSSIFRHFLFRARKQCHSELVQW